MNILVLIPAHNEASRVKSVIEKIRSAGLPVLVVNDGSTDDTASVAQKAGAEVISLPVNKGKGAAIREGFGHFLAKQYSSVILMDADGQHDTNDLPRFIQLISHGDSDMVIGDRMTSPGCMPWIRRATNSFMSFILSSACRQIVPDTQCGFRALKRQVVEKINLKTERFEIESEMILEAAKKGFKIGSVPIASVYAGEGSHIRPAQDTLRFFKFLFQYLLTK